MTRQDLGYARQAGMLFSLLGAFALTGAFGLTGCGGGGGGATAPASGPVAQQAPATVILRNVSNEAVYYVYMSPSSDTNWGADRLGASQVLAVGQQLTLSNIPPGMWDFRVVDASGNSKEWRNVRIDPGAQLTQDITSGGWTAP